MRANINLLEITLFSAWVGLSYICSVSANEQIDAGLGAIAHDIGGRVAGAPDGSSTFVGTWFPQIRLSTRWGEQWGFEPSLHYTFPWRSDMDDSSTRSILSLSGVASYSLSSIHLKGGAGYLIYFVSGKGGKAILNNGNSTSEFYKPNRTSMSRMFYLTLGCGLKLIENPPVRADFDVWNTGLLSERRAVSFLTSISYGFQLR